MRTFVILFAALLFLNWQLLGQNNEPIYLNNASFEDMARHSKQPRGWFDCGDEGESPPDVQPYGGFEVSKAAVEGETYLGMVVRDNETYEAVGQRLSSALEPNQCYSFSLALCRSEIYLSFSRSTDQEVNYTTPARIRIWGGNSFCNKLEKLDETTVITNTRWLEYNFRLEPSQRHQYILIEAFYKTPTLFPYNGNVLVDNASPIIPVPCDEPKPLTIEEVEQVEEPIIAGEQVETTPSPPSTTTTTSTQTTPPPPIVNTESNREEDNTTLGGFKREDIRKGQTIEIESLFFEADKAIIRRQSHPILDDIYKFLSRNQDVVVEIGGHTNSTPPDWYCDSLSTERAKAVALYLSDKGINEKRIKYKGYGKRYPIAPNTTPVGRKRNQRVEIKVLGFSG